MSLNLQQLFDLQHFEDNERLQSLIDDTMNRYGLSENQDSSLKECHPAFSAVRQEIYEEDLAGLYAAGNPDTASANSANSKEKDILQKKLEETK